ncbi:hypothetical protein ACJX0J_031707, partial [Zea mays]
TSTGSLCWYAICELGSTIGVFMLRVGLLGDDESGMDDTGKSPLKVSSVHVNEFIKDEELIPFPPQEKRKMNTNVSVSEDVGKNVGAAARAMAKDRVTGKIAFEKSELHVHIERPNSYLLSSVAKAFPSSAQVGDVLNFAFLDMDTDSNSDSNDFYFS